MRPTTFSTTVGAFGGGRDGREVVIVNEPTLGSTLRTRGRFFLICEADPPSRRALEIAREVGETIEHDHYYDLSAGIEVGLRRAVRKANRRAAQLVREERARPLLHLACAVVVNNELYAVRVGGAHVFLVRHARLFLPGDEPGELADFVHRTTTRQAGSLGAEMDLVPLVWRQTVEAGDTVVLASRGVVDGVGADALKNAAITLHPRAAAEHIGARAVAEGAPGSHATLFVEVAPATGAAARLVGEPEVPLQEPAEVVIAETIRSRVDTVWSRMPRVGDALAALGRPIARALAGALGVVVELMPHRSATLPRRPRSARVRSAHGRRVTALLAALLLLVTAGIGALVLQDYRANQVVNDYRIAIVAVENELVAARGLASRDKERAWDSVTRATERLDAAARSPAAEPEKVAALRKDIAAVEDQLNGVIIDLAAVPSSAGAKPADLTQTVNGLYAADPGTGRLWRIYGEPIGTGVVLQRGSQKVGTPLAVTADGEALLTLDDTRTVWRAQGNTVAPVDLPKPETWKSATHIATFAGNVYLLDPAAGQVWRYAPNFAGVLDGPLPFLPQILPAGSAAGLAVDGDIWVLTTSGEVQRYRKQGLEPVLTRIPFTVQWSGAPLRPSAMQAIETQRSIWLLDAAAHAIAQVTRDGRELARFSIPERLPPPTAFFVSEGQSRAYTVHGSKIVVTDVAR